MARWQPLITILITTPLLLTQATVARAQNSLDEQLRQPVNRTALSQDRDIADQLLRLGRQQAIAGQYEMAIRAWTRAADLYYAVGDRSGMGNAYENIGLAYAQLGDYDAAESAIRRQLAIARDAQDFEAQIFASNHLGTLRLQRGDTTAATAAYEDALVIAQSIDHYAGMGLSLSNLGLLAATQGHYEDAVKYYETAGNYRSRVRDSLGQAHTNNNLGDTYLAMDRVGSAIGAYRLALVLGREQENIPVQLHALTGLIDVYSDRNDWPQVRTYLDERLALVTASEDTWQQLVTLQQLGAYYEATDALGAAQTAYRQALALAQALQQKQLEGELTNRLMVLAQQLGEE